MGTVSAVCWESPWAVRSALSAMGTVSAGCWESPWAVRSALSAMGTVSAGSWESAWAARSALSAMGTASVVRWGSAWAVWWCPEKESSLVVLLENVWTFLSVFEWRHRGVAGAHWWARWLL